MCCDIMVCNTIHFVRAVEAQKSLSRIQRIKNKLRNFGKKKTERKDEKPQLADQSSIDVEMTEDDQYCEFIAVFFNFQSIKFRNQFYQMIYQRYKGFAYGLLGNGCDM